MEDYNKVSYNLSKNMADVLTPAQRKYNMSQIKGKDTAPEIVIRRLLYSNGIRGYRIHYPLPGKPDIVFIRKRLIVFIDGCFWHKCPECFTIPQTRTEFWLDKLNKNVERDRKVNKKLTDDGWNVLRFWEHEVRENPEEIVRKILSELKNSKISDTK